MSGMGKQRRWLSTERIARVRVAQTSAFRSRRGLRWSRVAGVDGGALLKCAHQLALEVPHCDRIVLECEEGEVLVEKDEGGWRAEEGILHLEHAIRQQVDDVERRALLFDEQLLVELLDDVHLLAPSDCPPARRAHASRAALARGLRWSRV